jgi:hypothetical protein
MIQLALSGIPGMLCPTATALTALFASFTMLPTFAAASNKESLNLGTITLEKHRFYAVLSVSGASFWPVLPIWHSPINVPGLTVDDAFALIGVPLAHA